MPYQKLSVVAAAEYLHLPLIDVEKLIQKRDIPFENINGQISFRKKELRDWLTQRVLSSKEKHLNEYHKVATPKAVSCPDRSRTFLSDMLDVKCMVPFIEGRTKRTVLKSLAKAGFDTTHLCDEKELYQLLEEREELCPTGIEKGIAIPHTRVHSEYLFFENFMIIARCPSGIPFGAVDGRKTNLFFMPCAMDDQLHLYMVTRIALMVQKTDLADKLRDAEDEEEMLQVFRECEVEFIQNFIEKKK